MPAPLNFKRHFSLLIAALIMMVALNAANLFDEPFLPSFAIYGALHALTVVLALNAPQSGLGRKALFVASAAVLNVAVLYAGIFSLEVLDTILAAVRLYLALAICALFGAMAYGFLIRLFWIPSLRPRSIAQIAMGCAGTALAAMAVQNRAVAFGTWWFVAVWWFAFSGGLWRAERRAYPFRPQPHAQ